MKLFISIFSLFSFNAIAYLNLDFLPLAEKRLKIKNKDIAIITKGEARSSIIATVDDDSVHWVRFEKTLLLPKARLKLAISKSKYKHLSLHYKNKNIHFEKHQGHYSTELYISLFEFEKVSVRNKGQEIANITVKVKNKKSHLIDYTCSRNNIRIENANSEILSVGCETKRIGKFGKEKPLLIVKWISPNLTQVGSNKNYGEAVFTHRANVNISAQNINTGKKKVIKIKSSIPKRLHRLFTAYGYGPYALETESKKEGEETMSHTAPIAPALFFYLNYKISETNSIRGFNAAVFETSGFNNAGAYLGSDFGFALDNKLYFTTLLGVQHLFFKFNDETSEVSEFIFPQGIEFMYRHAFDIPNYIISGGAFLSPSENFDYQNIWIRWGKNYFWELNYIFWSNNELSAKMWGLSVGFPFKGFL